MANRVRTTVTLPSELLASMDEAVERGWAHSRNELLAAAARHELERYERELVDAQFADMASDGDYQRNAARLARELDPASWEALRMVDDEP